MSNALESPNARPNVLVVEDDPVHRKLVIAGLKSIDCERLFEAPDGVAACEILRRERIDIAVTDLDMPRMGGLELIGWAKEHAPDPVWVILSALDTFDAATDAIRRGAFDFIPKPVEQKKLEASVLSAWRHRQLVVEKERLNRELRVALESSPNGAVMVDASGRILLVNLETEKLFGYDRDELIGAPVELLVPERLGERHSAHRAAFLSDPGRRAMGLGRELRGRRKDGSEFPIEVGLNPVETEKGTGVIASVSDVTERRQIEATLRRAKDRARAFVAAAVGLVLVLAAGALGVSRLQAVSEELAAVRNHNLPLALEIGRIYALQLEQDALLERTLRFAQMRVADANAESLAIQSVGDLPIRITTVEYRRAIALYQQLDQKIREHIARASGILDADLRSVTDSARGEEFEDLRASLTATENLYGNYTQRAQGVIELLHAGEPKAARELWEEVGTQGKQNEELVAQMLAAIQASTDSSVTSAGATYRRGLFSVIVLAGFALITLVIAAILASRASRLRRRIGGAAMAA